MAKINVDTTKLINGSESIKKLSNDFTVIIEDLFNDIKNLNENGIWVGDANLSSVNKYISIVSKEKGIYTEYAKVINDLGIKIYNYAKDLEVTSNDRL